MSQINVTDIYDANGGEAAKLHGVLTTPLGWRNRIINGKMDISQRGTSFAAVTNAQSVLDRWWMNVNGAASLTVSQQADTPSTNEFVNSLRITVNTANASLGAIDYASLCHTIEGYHVRDLTGRTFSVSFWVRSPKTGIHCVALLGGGYTYMLEYTVTNPNTWEWKTLQVPGGLPNSGSWNYTNGSGLSVRWSFGCGSTYRTTANAWNTGTFLSTANQVNCLDTIGNICAITGVQLELGAVSTPFEHRPIGVEQLLCDRYFQRLGFTSGAAATSIGLGVAPSGAAALWRVGLYTRAPLRAVPSISYTSLFGWNPAGGSIAMTGVGGIYFLGGTVEVDVALNSAWAATLPGHLQTNSSGTSYMDLNSEIY